jgi:hypothetical protein
VDLRETGWVELAQDRGDMGIETTGSAAIMLVGSCGNFLERQKSQEVRNCT